jgi:hypothetical protein
MIRRIRHLHFPARRLTTAATQEFDPPSCASDPGLDSVELGREGGDAPSGHRCIRQSALARRLPAIAPAPQQKSGDAGAFRGELQPAARHCGKRSDFTDHRNNAGSAQSFLHRPKDVRIVRRPDQQDAPRVESVSL